MDLRKAFIHVSQEMIKELLTEVFATNQRRVVEATLATPAPHATLFDKALLWLLVNR